MEVLGWMLLGIAERTFVMRPAREAREMMLRVRKISRPGTAFTGRLIRLLSGAAQGTTRTLKKLRAGTGPGSVPLSEVVLPGDAGMFGVRSAHDPAAAVLLACTR